MHVNMQQLYEVIGLYGLIYACADQSKEQVWGSFRQDHTSRKLHQVCRSRNHSYHRRGSLLAWFLRNIRETFTTTEKHSNRILSNSGLFLGFAMVSFTTIIDNEK